MHPEPTLVAVFLTGLLGGVHCAGMCGGIVGALALLGRRGSAPASSGAAGVGTVRTSTVEASSVAAEFPESTASLPTVPRSPTGAIHHGATPCPLATQLAYNVGRLSSYAVLGAVAGTAGSFGWLYGEALPLQQAAFAATSVLLVLMGLYVAGAKGIGHRFERLGSGLWRHLRPLATASLARASSAGGALLAGALWGLVPCGMVYAVLAGALLSGSAASGAALMLAFGLGTLPNLLLLGCSAGRLGRLLRGPRLRLGAGALIAAFGVLGLLRLDVARQIPLLGELCVRLPPIGS